ncbi:MAG: dihydrofolate reductase [Lachnospiraceae bacterium]|nr:dihydrofolate reductase [Lachnospiraceae bacterium]
MNLIVAVDKNWAIGNGNRLLTSIPNDMKNFRRTTLGKVVVMGRKTLESFPNGLPLDQRVNIVLTSKQNYQVKGAIVVHSLKELEEELQKYQSGDIFVIGGESIYRQLLPKCEMAYVTKIDYAFQADTWMPDLDALSQWQLIETGEEQTYSNLEYYFLKYSQCKEGQ